MKVNIKLQKRDVEIKDIPIFYKTLTENKISVGVHKEQGRHNVEKALWNEFGVAPFRLATPMKKKLANGKFVKLLPETVLQIPARPFVRLYLHPSSLENFRKYYEQEMNYKFLSGLKTPAQDAKNLLNDVSDFTEEQMKKNVVEGNDLKRNAPLTIAIKGFDYPLVETGKMLKSIKGKVEKI